MTKHINKTLYFDINTAVKVTRTAKKLKVSESKLVRHAINRVTYAELYKELVEDIKHAQFIKRKHLLK